jgi:hypothetical protein
MTVYPAIVPRLKREQTKFQKKRAKGKFSSRSVNILKFLLEAIVN